MKNYENVAVARMGADGAPETVAHAQYLRINAEIRLLRFRRSLSEPNTTSSPAARG